MNLALLDPFRRQIPDRVDSTLSLPSGLHPPLKKSDNNAESEDRSSVGSGAKEEKPKEEDDPEHKAAYHVAFNRRGTYLAVGHAKGTVAVHDFMSRTLSALYRPPPPDDSDEGGGDAISFPYGVTSVTWSRRSRTLLAGAVGDAQVRLFDTTHPLGPEECCPVLATESDTATAEGSAAAPAAATPTSTGESPKQTTTEQTSPQQRQAPSDSNAAATPTSATPDDLIARQPRRVHEVKEIQCSSSTSEGDAKGPTSDIATSTLQERHEAALKKMREQEKSTTNHRTKRYATLLWELPEPVGGSLQVHPRQATTGLAVLASGSLIVFRVPRSGFESYPALETKPICKYVVLHKQHHITCAAFDPSGNKVYAASKNGILMVFQVTQVIEALQHTTPSVENVVPTVELKIPGGATVWHLLVSRNGKFLLLNCADSALRLYNTAELKDEEKPALVFQDVVSKAPFCSCDFSGDAEYVVGGCNGNDDKYELYLWNTATGALMDRLTGAQVSLYSVAWHPTRSFLAVATSDGLVDIWGPRMDWTAFAPDFQALPMNVEYVEREDEFDVVVDNKKQKTTGDDSSTEQQSMVVEEEEESSEVEVDVVTVDPVPVFASDSESESEVFYFDTKIKNIMAGQRRNTWGAAGKPAAEEKE